MSKCIIQIIKIKVIQMVKNSDVFEQFNWLAEKDYRKGVKVGPGEGCRETQLLMLFK